ncbi:MAG: HlyD family efflux transporter periplasmic adaptor subunit [Granulosicoccus sp.]|nr:HlyD family efflux transporter periplasmic adaptor subunit [Granulosicoccus sp.]
MNEQSPSHWQSVCRLCPQQVNGVQYQDRMVRGEPWTFVHSEVTGQHVRINGINRQVVSLLDGCSAVEQLLEMVSPESCDDEKEALALGLLALASYGLISLNTPAAQSQLQQQAAESSRCRARAWHNPLAIRLPLMDPDAWLERIDRACRGVSVGALVKIAVSLILSALLVAALHTRELADQIAFIARTPQQWWQMIVLYPLLKCIHEFAHAMLVKRFGGSVHEVGITLLVLMPVPYLDASDSWRLESRRQRILVSAAGMLAEGAVAALGLFTWLLVEPGVLHDMGFALALTGSVSTLLFNANPLLKFDGYQILQDTIDIPDLAPRASRYLRYLFRRHVLGIRAASSPVSASGERRWFIAYGLSAGVYRWVLTLSIALYLATRFPILGSLLALFALFQLIVRPVIRAIAYLARSPELQDRRSTAALVSGIVASTLIAIFLLVPAPTSTRAQGVVSVPSQARLFAPYSGEIASLNVSDGQLVARDQLLLTLRSPELTTRLAVTRSELDVIGIRYQAALVNDIGNASSLREDLQETRRLLSTLSDRVESLKVKAGTSGTVKLDSRLLRVGQYVQAGTSLGHIVNADSLRIKAVVRESDISRVKAGVRQVNVRLAERFSKPLDANLVQETPAANRDLPSQAMAGNGLGGIAVASKQDRKWETVEPVFHLELELPQGTRASGIGGRAYVTLTHEAESLGNRSWRTLRQLLLDQLAI